MALFCINDFLSLVRSVCWEWTMFVYEVYLISLPILNRKKFYLQVGDLVNTPSYLGE